MSHVYHIYVASKCSDGPMDLFKRYLIMFHSEMFGAVGFSPVLAVFSAYSNFMATFYWNFSDLFVITISIALASRFRLLNTHLTHARGMVITLFQLYIIVVKYLSTN